MGKNIHTIKASAARTMLAIIDDFRPKPPAQVSSRAGADGGTVAEVSFIWTIPAHVLNLCSIGRNLFLTEFRCRARAREFSKCHSAVLASDEIEIHDVESRLRPIA